jgi:hypothetical protein
MLILTRALYLFAPLLFSAVVSAVVHRYELFSTLARPIDGGAYFCGARVFGDGKTWRGLAIAVFGSIAMVLLQKHVLAGVAQSIALVDYADANPVAVGLAFGIGAVAGELPNSFVKRRLGIARGETAKRPSRRVVFWIWDQIDTVTLTWLFLLPWVSPTASLVFVTAGAALILHPLIAFVGWLLGARKSAR